MKQSLLQKIYYEYTRINRFNDESQIDRVREAEKEFSAVLNQIKNDALVSQLEDAANYVDGAYEMQGFMMGAKFMAELFSEINNLFPAGDDNDI